MANNYINKHTFLVTGGAGFIGSNIVEHLIRHKAQKVRILDNLATGFKKNIDPYLKLPNVEFIEGDITDIKICQAACEDVDYVFHEAALGSVPRSIENPVATNEVNVNGFLNMLVAARDAKVRRLVYASSSSVYGDIEMSPKKEENIGNPLSPYAVSKLTNEVYAGVFSKVYKMELIGLRYFNIFGPRQSPQGAYAAAIPLFMNGLVNNEPVYINGDGTQTRDFTFVENAVQANIKAAFTDNKEAIGQVFNIACGQTTSINELFNTLKELAQSDMDAIHREKRVGDVANSLADISKAKQLLEYEPTVEISEGLKRTFEWFVNRDRA